MAALKIAATFIVLIFALGIASAADYECVFENRGQVNCNAYQAGNTYCYQAGPGPVANNPAVAVSCTNNSPYATGQIVCRLSNYSGSASTLRCSNTPYYVSGPTLVGGTVSSCPYNDCEINQIACASTYAYRQCVQDSATPGCNKWESKNCAGNARCFSQTTAELAKCVGVQENRITLRNGVYYMQQEQGTASPGAGGQTGSTTQPGSGAYNNIEPSLQYFGFAGDAKINVLDQGTDPAMHYGVLVQKNAVVSISYSDLPNPNFSVVVSRTASNAIKNSSDPVSEAKTQLKNNEITITAYNLWDQIRLIFFKISLQFFG